MPGNIGNWSSILSCNTNGANCKNIWPSGYIEPHDLGLEVKKKSKTKIRFSICNNMSSTNINFIIIWPTSPGENIWSFRFHVRYLHKINRKSSQLHQILILDSLHLLWCAEQTEMFFLWTSFCPDFHWLREENMADVWYQGNCPSFHRLVEILSHIKTNVIPLILINHTFKVFLGSILMSWYLFEQKCLTSLTISPGRGYFILISFYHLISSIFWWCNLWMITIHSRICYVYILSSSYIILFNLRLKLDYTNQIFCESYTGPPAPIEPGIV